MQNITFKKFLAFTVLFIILSRSLLFGTASLLAPAHLPINCGFSEMVHGVSCPSHDQPIERGIFNAEAFMSLLESRNRLQISFSFLAMLEFLPDINISILIFLVPTALYAAYIFNLHLQEPMDTVLRKKLNRWARLLLQSPSPNPA